MRGNKIRPLVSNFQQPVDKYSSLGKSFCSKIGLVWQNFCGIQWSVPLPNLFLLLIITPCLNTLGAYPLQHDFKYLDDHPPHFIFIWPSSHYIIILIKSTISFNHDSKWCHFQSRVEIKMVRIQFDLLCDGDSKGMEGRSVCCVRHSEVQRLRAAGLAQFLPMKAFYFTIEL